MSLPHYIARSTDTAADHTRSWAGSCTCGWHVESDVPREVDTATAAHRSDTTTRTDR